MMGILDRIGNTLKRGASNAFAPAPDPRVTHLTSYQKQRALLDQVAAAINEVSKSKDRLAATATAVRDKLPAMQDQAREDLKAGRPAMARVALQRRQVALLELQTLDKQLEEVEKEEASLSIIEQRLSGQIEAFTARQEVIRARYSAAEAQVRINEAMTGVSQEFADLSTALQHAEEKTQSMQARATAIDRLVQEGDLIAIGAGADEPPTELADVEADVERQLADLQRSLG